MYTSDVMIGIFNELIRLYIDKNNVAIIKLDTIFFNIELELDVDVESWTAAALKAYYIDPLNIFELYGRYGWNVIYKELDPKTHTKEPTYTFCPKEK